MPFRLFGVFVPAKRKMFDLPRLPGLRGQGQRGDQDLALPTSPKGRPKGCSIAATRGIPTNLW